MLLYEPGATSDALLAFYSNARPVLDPARAEKGAGELLRRLRVPVLDIERLIADVARIPEALGLGGDHADPARLEALHALLEALRAEIPERLRRTLAELPIWPDRAGRPGVLRGSGGAAAALVRVPAEEAVVALFAGVRFVDAKVGARGHVQDMGIDRLGVAAGIDALAPRAGGPWPATPAVGGSAGGDVLDEDLSSEELDEIHAQIMKRLGAGSGASPDAPAAPRPTVRKRSPMQPRPSSATPRSPARSWP